MCFNNIGILKIDNKVVRGKNKNKNIAIIKPIQPKSFVMVLIGVVSTHSTQHRTKAVPCQETSVLFIICISFDVASNVCNANRIGTV